MKAFFIYLLLLFSFAGFAQSPDKINYQGMLRDGTGLPLPNTAFTIRFEILQGSATGSAVFTEQQSLQTNSLGLFSTQIGAVNNLGVINWSSSSHFLQVSVDPAGGTNFVAMGNAQQLISVPYALNANSVPATFSNNVLTIGTNNSFTLNAASDATLTGTGAASVVSSGNSHTIDVPVPTFTGAGTTTVTGTYPNYTINSQSISQPQTSLTSSGIGTVTSIGTNSFDINVPQTNLTGTGGASVTGTFPNYTINAPSVVSYTSGTGIAITSGSIINTLPNQTVTLNGTGATTVTGTYPNFTINSPTFAASPQSTLTSSGIGTVTSAGTNSFNINVPQTNLTGTGAVTVSGTFPNYTVNAPAATNYTAGTGISIASGSI
ncbi:MAG: hypothetical protein MUF75_05370, partial [Bacteroidia bacterium]|nr:hypothetical protein [Bacteroidia bacterium]